MSFKSLNKNKIEILVIWCFSKITKQPMEVNYKTIYAVKELHDKIRKKISRIGLKAFKAKQHMSAD